VERRQARADSMICKQHNSGRPPGKVPVGEIWGYLRNWKGNQHRHLNKVAVQKLATKRIEFVGGLGNSRP
jgi:hypothetical protein